MVTVNMKKCPVCGEYTLDDKCRACGEKTMIPKPAKFSPEDRYGRYRRMMKEKIGLD